MLVQNNNRTNLPRGQSTCLDPQQSKLDRRDSSAHNFMASSKQPHNNNLLHSTSTSTSHQPLRMKTQNSTTNFRNNTGANPNKPHLTRRSTFAASKENASVDGFHHILPISKAMSSTENTLNMSRAFSVIQNGADTSFAALENPNCPNMIAKHVQKVAARALSSGRHSTMASKPSQSRMAAPLRSQSKTFAELCPCKKGQNNAQNKSLIEERHGNFNCSSCGAMAFRSCKIGAIDEPQSIFALKLEEECSRVEAPPQKILEQLRESSESQRSELRAYVPSNDTFDSRILQVRDTILELICEVGDCLKQSQLTIHLAVEYMDRFLLLRINAIGNFAHSENDTDLFSRLLEGYSADDIALTSLLLASKFDEIDDNIPLIQEMSKGHSLVRDSLDSGFLLSQSKDRPRLTRNRSYPGFHAIQRCELYLLRVLCWDLNTITPLHFVQNHLYQGVLFTNDRLVAGSSTEDFRKALQKVRRHIDYFALQAIKQEFMLSKLYSDQTVAAAIIFAARKASKVVEYAWNESAFKQMFGINQAVTSVSEVQECFNVLYRVYDQSHRASTTFKSHSEVIVNSKAVVAANPFKIEINFQQVDKAGVPVTVETERVNQSIEEEVKALKKTQGQSGSSEKDGLSTRGCEVSHSENSGVETLAQSMSMTNNEDFSQVVENSQTISSGHENSSSSGIEESIEVQKEAKPSTGKSKTRKSVSKSGRSRSNTNQVKNKSQQQSSQKTGSKKTTASKTSSVTTFDQQTTLKPTFVSNQPEVTNGNKSLSPIKEFRDRDGPIKIFKQKEEQQPFESRVVIRDQNSRERSDSQTSLFRLQPTMVRTSDFVQSKTTTHLRLQPRAIVSDESLAKRNNQRSGHRQSTTPPNVLNFSQINNKSGIRRPMSRKSVENDTSDKAGSQERACQQILKKATFGTKSNVSMQQDLIVVQHRNSESQEKRQAMSKSVICSRKTEQEKLVNSEIPESFAEVVVVNDNTELVSQNLKSDHQQRCISALSQSKTPIASAEIGNGMRSRDQNFIKRNINYVTKLDQKTKERKSLHASRSFIETDNNKSKPSTPYDSTKYDQVANEHTKVNDLQKYNEQVPKLSRYGGAKSLKRFSTAASKSLYMSNQVSEAPSNANIQLITSTNVVTTKEDCNQTTVTPKQMSYRPSKLFSKKQSSMGVTQSTNTSVAEQPRSSNPTKTALHKFKAAHRTNSFGGVASLHSRNAQARSGLDQSCSTQGEAQQHTTVARDLSQTPMDTSSTMIGGANKSRPQNNHLKPTKSSMLRAKSSLGLSTVDEAAKAAISTTNGGKVPIQLVGGGRAAVTTTMANNEQVLIKFNSNVTSVSTRAGSQTRIAQQSPQFGGLRARKFQSNESSQAPLPLYTNTACYGGYSKLEVDLTVPSAIITTSNAATAESQQQQTTPANQNVQQTHRERKSTAKSQSGPVTRRQQQHTAVAAAKKTATSKLQQTQPNSRESNCGGGPAFRGTFSIR